MKLILLSDDFYNRHSQDAEMLHKRNRPYACVAVKIQGRTFAIPFRHHITHNHSFITYGICGLDYTKSVIIMNPSDVSNKRPTIDQREFNALKGKDALIANGMNQYIKLYKKAKRYQNNVRYQNILKCSTLQYFDHLLP